jgi:DNA-binding transcriptional LysR family regulator
MDPLLAGELDLAIAPVPRQRTDEFVVHDLFDDTLAVVADESHPLHGKRGLRLADLIDQEWLLPGAHILLRLQLEAAFAQRGLPPPNLRVESDFGSASLFYLMRGTRMLSIAGAQMARPLAGFRALRLSSEELDLRRRVGVIARAGAYLSPLAQRMVAILQERAK